ncbi:MAG: UDP-glucose/GDP-mannose dehydrogenase family protein [Candidatus Margulisiibacteriota bacterium]
MRICVIGSGYVGLVTGACLANMGNYVICADKDLKKVESLRSGHIHFYEPGLEDIVKFNLRNGRISFTQDLDSAIRLADVIFIAVGTPPKKDGSADISNVTNAAKSIAKVIGSMKKNKNIHKTIVNKSTVPVGMGDIVSKILKNAGISGKNFSVVSNPEFLSEGSAVGDFMNPDRIVIGASDTRAFDTITELYRSLNAHIIFTDIKTAEMIKYVSNSFLATKISFINEIANICEKIGVDVTDVAGAVGLDQRIGKKFLNAGLGYGGSCLPKDVSALINVAKKAGCNPDLLKCVNEINEERIDLFAEKIKKYFNKPSGKKIAVLGVSFKPGTDDIREAPSINLMKKLRSIGFSVSCYDPAAKINLIPGITVCEDVYSALKGCDAAAFVTEWPQFKQLNFEMVKKTMKKPVVFDGRNMLNPKIMEELGFKYFGVGR